MHVLHPNDARTEPWVPQTLGGILLLSWPFWQTRILSTLFNQHSPWTACTHQSECILTIISSAVRTSSSVDQQVITMGLESSSVRFLSSGFAHLLEGGAVFFLKRLYLGSSFRFIAKFRGIYRNFLCHYCLPMHKLPSMNILHLMGTFVTTDVPTLNIIPPKACSFH